MENSAPLSFGPALGAVIATRAEPGSYAGSMHFSLRKYPTQEKFVSQARAAAVLLAIGTDGRAEIRMASRRSSSFDASRYTSPDGKARHSQNAEQTRECFAGHWKTAGDDYALTFNAVGDSACGPAVAFTATESPWKMRCVSLRSRAASFTGSVLACQLDRANTGAYTLPLGANPSRGPDGGLTADGWLLLGASPGIRVSWSDDAHDATPEMKIIAATRPVTLEDAERSWLELAQ